MYGKALALLEAVRVARVRDAKLRAEACEAAAVQIAAGEREGKGEGEAKGEAKAKGKGQRKGRGGEEPGATGSRGRA